MNAEPAPDQPDDQGARLGRPRTFDDSAIFAATARVVGRMGSQLTLANVASEVGCTGQALYKRFGSKRGLLLSFADWLNDVSEERDRQSRLDHQSPLDALYARLLTPVASWPDSLPDAATLARALTFRLESIDDEEFREKWERRDRTLAAQITRSLTEAQDAGELAATADPQDLGETIHLAMTGAALVMAWRRDEAIADRFRTILNTVLGPHRRGET